MGLKDKIQQIAQETATQVVASIVGGLVSNTTGLGTIQSFYTDANGNRLANVLDQNGNTVSGVYIASNRPLGVGSAISLVGDSGSFIGQ